MEWAALFSEDKVVTFLFLFFRFAALFMLVPIFDHKNIPMTIKTSLALFFTFLFYPLLPPTHIEINIPTVLMGVLGELMLGLTIGVVLKITFEIITFAGGQISTAMGFSMASAMDPQSGVSNPLIASFMSLIVMMMMLSLDMHHWIILFIGDSLESIPLGGFILNKEIVDYIIKASAHMLVVGFMIAFPVYAMTFLNDLMFGMLMKTMPQFNLLVIGMPAKITLGLIVIIVTLTSTMLIMKREIVDAFNWLEILL
ncbi:MAG: flagellar type III secretion system protein FliR [Helicobacteraceae bacterium]|nr:flagellar type III secretion system protein FliR [Helicobacteraceae bacterium]